MNKLIFVGIFLTFVASTVTAQIAQGGNYTIGQSVIGAGGGTSQDATRNVYKIEGTIGQSAAGAISTAPNYSLKGGFWSAQLVPTAAGATISGRVTTVAGKGIRNVSVTMMDASGATRTIVSGEFGRFVFEDVPSGSTYILSVSARRFTFSQPEQVLAVSGNLDDLIFVGESNGLQSP